MLQMDNFRLFFCFQTDLVAAFRSPGRSIYRRILVRTRTAMDFLSKSDTNTK